MVTGIGFSGENPENLTEDNIECFENIAELDRGVTLDIRHFKVHQRCIYSSVWRMPWTIESLSRGSSQFALSRKV